jgi:hypothetical protein
MLVAHTVNKISGDEKLVVGIGKENWLFVSYHKHPWNHKRQTKISSWRWISRNSISVHFVYKTTKIDPEIVKVVNDETILKILYHYRGYLEICGMRNFNKIGDVILD